MNEEGSLFDVPPAAFGRYRVLKQLGAGTTGPVFLGEDSETHAQWAIKVFTIGVPPDRATAVAEALDALTDRLPRQDVLTVPVATGVNAQTPYLVTKVVDGDSLQTAWRKFGPAAIADVVPRVEDIAKALDAAHAAGVVHGRLHPKDILVSADRTHVIGLGVAPILAKAEVELAIRAPYSAPEVTRSGGAGAASDQFALAAITFEWLFGRRIAGPAEQVVAVPSLPGVDRDAIAKAFTRALAAAPANRFGSCTAFSEALAASVTHELPLAAADQVEHQVAPVRWWQPSATYATPRPAERFGGGMVVAALLVGMVAGFAAGYMARPRALQSGSMAVATSAQDSVRPADVIADTPADRVAPAVPVARPGRLVLRSVPARASVVVDGVARGVTPLVLRDLELGFRTIALTRPGYLVDEQRVELTAARPSRSIDIRLKTAAPVVTTGTLVVESRPAGAAVLIDGRPSGTTPVTIKALEAGNYRVSLSLTGYRPFETTVRVVAGARARAAASLSTQE